MSAGGRIVNPVSPEQLGSLVLRLRSDAEAEATGREVVECIRTACLERDLEDVATLHTLFRNVVCRVPEFHVLLHELHDAEPQAITKILRIPKRGAGRPREDEFFFVALIEYVMQAQDLEQVNDAVEWLMEHRSELQLPDNYLPAAKTLKNKHAALGHYYRLWSRSMYVAPELLTLLPPLPPGVEPDPAVVERCRYPPPDGSPWPYGVLIEIRHPKK